MRLYNLICLLFVFLICAPGGSAAEKLPLNHPSGPGILPDTRQPLPEGLHFARHRHRKARSTEFGISIGVCNYTGDVAEKVWVWPETRPAYGAYVRHTFAARWALKAQVLAGNIGGSDAYAEDKDLRSRGIRFKSHWSEFSLQGEWYFAGAGEQERLGIQHDRLAPYLFAGVGGVMMHPLVEPANSKSGAGLVYPMQESGLAGTAVVLPFGGGFRLKISEKVTLCLEGGWRPVLSDYLDGVSKNGNPGKNDWYYTALASLSWGF